MSETILTICSECDKPILAKGLCNKHYMRLKRTGSVKDKVNEIVLCSYQDCQQEVVALNLCDKHYRRLKKFGTTELPKDPLPRDGYKFCTKCGAEKLLKDFYKDITHPSGYCSCCKECKEAQPKDRVKQRQRCSNWRAQNPDYSNEYYSANKQYLNELLIIRRAGDPERFRVIVRNYRAKKRAAPGKSTSEEITALLNLFDNQCLSCGSKENIEIDHIIPLSLGGTNYIWNLQPLCRSCNATKGNRNSADYRQNYFDRYNSTESLIDNRE
jgi:5-methylcytosine-specific restriction endonuclease McrA